MGAQKFSVGTDVLSFCSKCNLALSHIIISLNPKGIPHHVQCNTCKGKHNFKDPVLAKSTGPKAAKSTKSKKADARPLADVWLDAVGTSNGKQIKYTIKHKFLKGDLLDHSVFGPGVVQTIVDNDKIEVIFRHEIKTLIHNK